MKKIVKKENYLLKDSALGETDVKYDFFHHEDLSNEIAELLLNEDFKPPYNIALIGKWGLGKTSLLNLVKRRISPNCKVIEINAWKYEKEDLKKVYLKELYSGIKKKPFLLFGTLMQELKKIFKNSEGAPKEKDNITWKKIWSALKDFKVVIFFSFLLSTIWQASIFITKNGFPKKIPYIDVFAMLDFYFENMLMTLIIPILLYFLKKNIDKEEKNILQLPDINYYDDYEELIKLEIDKSLEEWKKEKIVVIIDDLDRLSTKKMVETLDVLKSLMELPNCVFIVPFDDTIIKSALDNNVIKDLVNEHQIIKSELILDKLFAFKFYLPLILPLDLKEYTLDLLEKMPGFKKYFEPGELEDIIKDIIIYPGIETPRQIKKILNLYSINFRVLLNRKNNNNTEESVLDNNGKKILAVLAVLQADFNEFYDTLFVESNNIDILMKIHNANTYEEKKDLINKSIEYLFDIDEKQMKIVIRDEYVNLVNFLSNIQFIDLNNLLPYIYLKQDTISAKYGSKLSIELTNAAESLNIPTVIKKLDEIKEQKEIIFSIFETATEHRKINVINSFSMAYSHITDDIKEEVANKISKEFNKVFSDEKMNSKINYSTYNLENLLNIFIDTSEKQKVGIEKMVTSYLNQMEIEEESSENIANMINLMISKYNNISTSILDIMREKTVKRMLDDETDVVSILRAININSINGSIFNYLFGEKFLEVLCNQLENDLTEEDKEIISSWLVKVSSYCELSDDLVKIIANISSNEKNLKYLNRIFVNDEGEIYEN